MCLLETIGIYKGPLIQLHKEINEQWLLLLLLPCILLKNILNAFIPDTGKTKSLSNTGFDYLFLLE